MNVIFPSNVKIYPVGHESFENKLASAKAVITNGGHTLLSESMYLKTPVYAIPFKNI